MHYNNTLEKTTHYNTTLEKSMHYNNTLEKTTHYNMERSTHYKIDFTFSPHPFSPHLTSPFIRFSFPGDRIANANWLSLGDDDQDDDEGEDDGDGDEDDDEACFTSSMKLCIQGTVWQPLHPHRWI